MTKRDWFRSFRPRRSLTRALPRVKNSFEFEALEPRTLLSGAPVATFDPRSDQEAEYSAIDQVVVDQLATAAPYLAKDFGDYYFSGTEKIPLLRYEDQFLIRVAKESTVDDVFTTLSKTGAPLASYRLSKTLDQFTFIASSAIEGPSGQIDASALKAISGVDWATPLFQLGREGSWYAVNDEVIVALKPGVEAKEFFGSEFKSWRPLRGTSDQFVATLAEGAGVATLEVANRLHVDPRVQWASANSYGDVRQAFAPSDPLYSNQWHLNNTGQFSAKVDADADLAEAWDVTQGNAGAVIAVIDDGVQTNHPDLNIWTNPGEVAGNGVDDDGNGWIDDVNGWNFWQPGVGTNNPNPVHVDDNHGTAVAGVAAAAGNSTGVSGVARNARIMAIKVAQAGVFTTYDRIAEATYYAAGRTADGLNQWDAADLLNMSFGALATTSVPVFDAAINWATTSGRNGLGATVLAAAGNAAAGTTAGLSYESFSLTGIPAGNWIFEWRYEKSASGAAGLDSGWLGNVRFPNGATERFDAAGLPAGWSTSGNVGWSVIDDPAHAYGTGRYVAKAGAIGDSQTSRLRSPTITVSSTGTLTFNSWVSSQASLDGLRLYVSNNGGASFSQQSYFRSGLPALQATVSYPANLSAPIAVGASADWDYRSAYSQYGAALDVVAPSNGGYAGVTTVDRTGEDGYNKTGIADGDGLSDLNYTTTFGGTSSATPLTAGIAALLLSKNPHLTPAQIRSTLQNTADKIGGNNGATAYAAGFNQYYGYGRVNAAAALAATPTDVTGPRIANVTIKGSASTHAPFAFNKPNDANDSDGSGLQLRTVPVGGADSVSIQFDEQVSNVTAGSLTLRGVSTGVTQSLAAVGAFVYDATTQIATWKFSASLPADQYLVSLSDAVADIAGNALDGEWTNPFSVSTVNLLVSKFPSGNSVAGGVFRFVFTILPGDADLSDNYVTGSDYFLWASGFGGPGRSFNQGDFDGSGTTDSADLALWQANYGFNFYQLIYADFNHDGIVNGADLGIWSANFGSTGVTHAAGDADHDGDVDATDWIYLQRQIGVQLNWVA